MTTPQKKKKVHDMLSPKIADKRRARRNVAKRQTEAPVPPKVDNYRMNKPRIARSLNIQPIVAKRRKISETDGMPAVNGKSGKELVKKAVTKVKPKQPINDPRVAALSKSLTKDKGNGAKQKRRKATPKRIG